MCHLLSLPGKHMYLIFIHCSKVDQRVMPCVVPKMDSLVKETGCWNFCVYWAVIKVIQKCN